MMTGSTSELNEQLARVRAERDALREALKPFTYRVWQRYLSRNLPAGLTVSMDVTIGDLRRAHAAMEDS